MKILITGGTGFIGKALCRTLLSHGHHLTVLSRRPEKVPALCGEPVIPLKDLSDLAPKDHFHAIVNLAGEGFINARWTPERKRILLESRIDTTDRLVDFIARSERKPELLVNGSAVGYYGDRREERLDESSPGADGFGHYLCNRWENAARKAEAHGVRLCLLRTGLVIGEGGGFLQRMLPLFKLGLGGRIGDGRQWMSWIHRNDLIAMIERFFEAPHLNGVFNGTAPNPVTNREFTETLAKIVKRPAWLPVPAFALKLAMGEMAASLLGGQRVLPKRILEEGFRYEFETVEPALREALRAGE